MGEGRHGGSEIWRTEGGEEEIHDGGKKWTRRRGETWKRDMMEERHGGEAVRRNMEKSIDMYEEQKGQKEERNVAATW